ncbi:hypothetical protein CXG81DRAFT_25771 [Caulochytrium protostelioides]|uniref:P-loop containing nucleoside triphosphate hydrolase protein n=1 Tax=Caulochytrium protostelioides TaxID=1555241 RepID=A0A4V1IUS3_9FUNG|nr:hypothetical protein CXG81DRAFT_25771 [Caulochytrium protostelioides]|eukprot:RKP01559.1 hypothetical protein CXG81DRAFT_25771 [Caulochytrium protostelioides]
MPPAASSRKSAPQKLQVCLVGDSAAGKTAMANHLAEIAGSLSTSYTPTQGCRVLEFDTRVVPAGKTRETSVAIELWDLSGQKRYAACWPVLVPHPHAVIYVSAPPEATTATGAAAPNTLVNPRWLQLYPDVAPEQQAIFAQHDGHRAAQDGIRVARVDLRNPESIAEAFHSVIARAV